MWFIKKPKKHKCHFCKEKFVRDDMINMWLIGLACKRCCEEFHKY